MVVCFYPSEKYESIGMMTFWIYGKMNNVPVTINQLRMLRCAISSIFTIYQYIANCWWSRIGGITYISLRTRKHYIVASRPDLSINMYQCKHDLWYIKEWETNDLNKIKHPCVDVYLHSIQQMMFIKYQSQSSVIQLLHVRKSPLPWI